MNNTPTVTVPKILMIVEDELLLAIVLKDALEDVGYRVLDIATRHQEALGISWKCKPDLALVNIELADGDDGVALAHDLKALGVPVLFISGQPRRANLAKAVAIGSLSKPYILSEMVEAVDYLFRHENGDETRPGPQRLELFDPKIQITAAEHPTLSTPDDFQGSSL